MTASEIIEFEEVVFMPKDLKRILACDWLTLLISRAQYSQAMSNIMLSEKRITCWTLFLIGNEKRIFLKIVEQTALLLLKQFDPKICIKNIKTELKGVEFINDIKLNETILTQVELIENIAGAFTLTAQVLNQSNDFICKIDSLTIKTSAIN